MTSLWTALITAVIGAALGWLGSWLSGRQAARERLDALRLQQVNDRIEHRHAERRDAYREFIRAADAHIRHLEQAQSNDVLMGVEDMPPDYRLPEPIESSLAGIELLAPDDVVAAARQFFESLYRATAKGAGSWLQEEREELLTLTRRDLGVHENQTSVRA